MIRRIFLSLCLLAGSVLYAQNLDYMVEGSLDYNNSSELFEYLNLTFMFDYKWFTLFSELGYTNEGKFGPAEARWSGDFYMLPGENYLSIDYSPFSFQIGRLDAQSNLDTPYSLYLTSQDITSLGANFTINYGPLFYNSRWIQLNYNSENTYPSGYNDDPAYDDNPVTWRDKGANHKTWGLKLGHFRFGMQDSNVYLDRSFDLEYFLSPLPQFLMQVYRMNTGQPNTEQNNDNSVMGGFIEYAPRDWYAYGQFLIDDINLSCILPDDKDVENLTKMAWSAGVSWNSPMGEWSFYHAGATKYTFEATYANYHGETSYSNIPYEYTYYPATEFPLNDEDMQTLWYYDNYLGYKYGENNLAFLLSYENSFLKKSKWEFNIHADLEWVLNGSKSPANPWHEYDSWTEIEPHVELLTDDSIENILRLSVKAKKRVWRFDMILDLMFGHVWNGLVLDEIAPDEPQRFVPEEGNDFFVYGAGIKFVLNLDIIKAPVKKPGMERVKAED
ncbi:MAG: hypothetical protein JW874_05455 [Spirochaetales bacterium]|nr:hypothetical protein [Spirochaetales bacterium]